MLVEIVKVQECGEYLVGSLVSKIPGVAPVSLEDEDTPIKMTAKILDNHDEYSACVKLFGSKQPFWKKFPARAFGVRGSTEVVTRLKNQVIAETTQRRNGERLDISEELANAAKRSRFSTAASSDALPAGTPAPHQPAPPVLPPNPSEAMDETGENP